ncbi:hypothetical protein [Ferrimicrobium sp.]|uniref:hypothetical protein n=3 Tax=Ferrimicrobium sp. TaxID=2926050 RepID=UPI0026387555|nr:hypothetical protein [Ferrimicrobium sp.]
MADQPESTWERDPTPTHASVGRTKKNRTLGTVAHHQALVLRRAGDRVNKTYRMIDQALSTWERDPTPTRASVGRTKKNRTLGTIAHRQALVLRRAGDVGNVTGIPSQPESSGEPCWVHWRTRFGKSWCRYERQR